MRFIVSALVLMFVGFIVPGFAPLTFWHALLAALVIAALGWIIEATMGGKCRPSGEASSASSLPRSSFGRPNFSCPA